MNTHTSPPCKVRKRNMSAREESWLLVMKFFNIHTFIIYLFFIYLFNYLALAFVGLSIYPVGSGAGSQVIKLGAPTQPLHGPQQWYRILYY